MRPPQRLTACHSGWTKGIRRRILIRGPTGHAIPDNRLGCAALALHGANLAASSGAKQYNFLGHSRGAVECIMAAWFLYAYGKDQQKVPINIFAIDPVPGPGKWYGILTQLPPNVANYVGVYAWDHSDRKFLPLVPRPNASMSNIEEDRILESEGLLQTKWDKLAKGHQLTDPLAPSSLPQPERYTLYACRGKHGTVAGNSTSNGRYNPKDVSESVAPVPKLVYKVARAYLTQWGTTFRTKCRVSENAIQLRQKIHTHHLEFDAMGGGFDRNSRVPGRLPVRRVSSIKGREPWDRYCLEDVAGGTAIPIGLSRNYRS